jgi:multicomponent Na+:H+ antiporter subunit B
MNISTLPLTIDFSLGTAALCFVATILCFISFKLAKATSLPETIILLSVFSLLISLAYLLMDAPDVAMTEVALGACLSTCVLLNFIKPLPEKFKNTKALFSVILCFIFVMIMLWLMTDLPLYGDIEAPLHRAASQYYIDNTKKEIGIPSTVAAVLASYRGYDTLGETSVILIAGIGVLLILSTQSKRVKNV